MTAVLLQYLRIFVPIRNRTFYLAWILISVNALFNLGLTLSFAFQCIPRQKIWTPSIPGQCINLGAVFLLSSVGNTITDFATFLLPLYTIWGLQLSRARKIRISGLFAVGLL